MAIVKRGVSPVIAAVLLIIITVAAAALIMSFVLPFVKDELSNSGSCLDVLEGIEFAESQFNCVNPASDESGFSVKINKKGIQGFRVGLIDDTGSSVVHTITEDDNENTLPGLRMVGGAALISYPSVGGQKSYVVMGQYFEAEISPVLKGGDVCPVSDKINIEDCGSVTL
jgi:flagellin-like protein